jgi:hypothetical protein
MSIHYFIAAEATPLLESDETYGKRKSDVQPPSFRPALTNNKVDANGAFATFYQSPLKGKLGVLGLFSSQRHLTVVIEQGDEQGEGRTSIGFYPINGNMSKSVFCHTDGELWSPDPLFNKNSVRLCDVNDVEIRVPMTVQQCESFNDIFRKNEGECRLIDGTTSSLCKSGEDCTKLDRFECPDHTKNYSLFASAVGYDNCITWLKHIFPTELASI